MQNTNAQVETEPTGSFSAANAFIEKYEISFESRDKYLYASAKGELSATENRVQCWSEILERCRAEDYDQLLVCQESPLNTSLVERFEAASQIVALGVHGIKIAYVDADPEGFEHNEFCALVARNRGANIEMFHTVEEAHDWLNK